MAEPAYDLAIVGGGLVGASLAVALADSGRRIALIEAAPPPALAPAWDERCIGLNAASVRIFEALGVWPAMTADAEPIAATHISERGRFGVARFTAAEAGLDALGYNTPLRAIHGALLARIAKIKTVDTICPARVSGCTADAARAELQLDDGRRIRAALVVACDGAASPLRRQLGIAARTHDYGQTAVITALRPQRALQNIAYERFTPDGPVAVLPRPNGLCTVVWTLPTARAEAALALDDEAFIATLQAAFGQRLGRFEALGRRSGYPLTQVRAETLSAPRLLFAGNAAQSLHPVAAQGFNLGLRDVAVLAESLHAVADPGAEMVLADYAARRHADRERTARFTDHLVRLFSNRVPGLAGLRHLGLLALDLAPPWKQQLLRQNLGYGGAVPALARGG